MSVERFSVERCEVSEGMEVDSFHTPSTIAHLSLREGGAI